LKIGIVGIFVTLIAAPPIDAYAQGRGHGRGQARHAEGPPGHVKKQGHRDRDRVLILDRDGNGGEVVIRGEGRGRDGEGRIVIRGDRRDDRRVRRQDGRVILRDDDGRVIVIREDGIDERFRVRGSRGPAFCRSGAGHPVFGRRWCLEKGFGLGDRDDVFFENGRVIFWDEDTPVIVRDRRFRDDRSLWERAMDRILFWRD
jgi:hypothetical protein